MLRSVLAALAALRAALAARCAVLAARCAARAVLCAALAVLCAAPALAAAVASGPGPLSPASSPPSSWTCHSTEKETFLDQANGFLLATLALVPVEASQAGYHQVGSQQVGSQQVGSRQVGSRQGGVSLDALLDDLSPETFAAAHSLLLAGRACFQPMLALTLPPEEHADLELLTLNIEEELFSLDELHSERDRPQEPVEMIGAGLFFPLTQQNGTEAERLANVVARMEQVPRALTQTKANLREADPVFTDAARKEAEGDKEVIAEIGTHIPASDPLHARYQSASQAATAALDEYARWLTDDLARRPHTHSWRSGPERYASIFRFAIGSDTAQTPASLLTAAEADLVKVREQMYTIALPLHAQWFPGHTEAASNTDTDKTDKAEAGERQVIGEVINRINDDHTTPANLLPEVRSQVASIEQFIRDKQLLTLSSRGNLRVVETPPFLREAFSVAGFHAPPALEPGGEGEYWVTPIGPETPAAAAESKLREYNNWMLQYLTMHEALPGHYTQFEHANGVEPSGRRILRALLGNGPYVEGWGEYGVKEMEDAGYSNHDPRFVLMVLKIRLRVIANAILDIRMQSMGMTDEEALALMEQKAFQTPAEAKGKLQRAKLTAGQLITYYVGFHQWIDFRDRYEKAAGANFRLKTFNDMALDEGPLPVPVLEKLMMSRLAADGR